MDWCYSVYTGCCSLAGRFIEACSHARGAYVVAEEEYGLDRSGEVWASTYAWLDCWSLCRGLDRLYNRIQGARLCIIGPNAVAPPGGCDAYAGPEPAAWLAASWGLRLSYITSDLDALQPIVSLIPFTADVAFIHVHSDNIYRVAGYRPMVDTIYTSQVCTPQNTLPLGGFTDGDRAVIIGLVLGASEIVLEGYGPPEASWYKSQASWKAGKLDVAFRIIRRVSAGLGYMVLEDGGGRIVIRSQS
ncbi:MAG: hypothetical protein GSR86_03180 [Desulfurococcales archaeon]|nr:hypothetical protein [Desulfurococcales archaeon]